MAGVEKILEFLEKISERENVREGRQTAKYKLQWIHSLCFAAASSLG